MHSFLIRIRSRFFRVRGSREEGERRERRDWVRLLLVFVFCIIAVVILGMIFLVRAKHAEEMFSNEAQEADSRTTNLIRLGEDVGALARLRASFEAALAETPPAPGSKR